MSRRSFGPSDMQVKQAAKVSALGVSAAVGLALVLIPPDPVTAAAGLTILGATFVGAKKAL